LKIRINFEIEKFIICIEKIN